MATALSSPFEDKQSNNLDEYSDDSDAESEKVRKAKKSKKKKKQATRSGVVLSLICNLIDEYEARPCLWNIFCDDYHIRDVTGKAKKELAGGKSEWTASCSLIARFRQTIMNYYGPFDRKHDSQWCEW